MSFKTRVQLIVLMLLVFGTWAFSTHVAGTLQADREQLLAQQMSMALEDVVGDIEANLEQRAATLTTLAQAIPPDLLSNPPRLQQYLEHLDTVAYVVDLQGNTLAAHPHPAGHNGTPFDGPWRSIDGLFVNRSGDARFIGLAVPLRDAQGNVAGRLIGAIENLSRHFDQTRPGKEGHILLIAPSERLVIAASDQRWVLQPLDMKGLDVLPERGFDTGLIKASLNGTATLNKGQRLKGTGWIALVGIPAGEALAAVEAFKRQIHLAALLMILAFVALLHIMLKKLLRPIEEVGQTMRLIAEGEEFPGPLPVSRKDEIGALVESFNHLEMKRRQAEQALSGSEARFHGLFIHLPSGFALHEVICNSDGKVVDFLYLDVNPVFEKIVGLSREQLVGYRVTQVLPDTEQYWIDGLGEVATTGKPKYFENYSQHNGKWFATHSYCPTSGQFASIIEDITERKLAEAKIEHLAYRDALTELPNRLLVRDRFERACAQSNRTETRVALLFLDLDNFKGINDSLGHLVGDELLKLVTARLRECVRDCDTIGRQGGDEFLIVLPEMPGADAVVPILLKINESLQAPFVIDGRELTTSVSIGAAIYPDDGNNFDVLLKKADTAMYWAKDAGRNVYHFFDEQMNAKVVEHLAISMGLRRALEQGEFALHYQPQINLASGAVIGAEALIRWNHPESGMILPARFIHIAEECGLIVQIGEWVIREACRQAAIWNGAGLPELPIAVNLSAVQFKRGNVEQAVIKALEEAHLHPSLLELELTESILIQDIDSVLTTISRLKLSGVKLSIDDFGTGYSSLSYLKRLAVDKLKIDQSFIRDLTSDSENVAIVRAIIQMAQSLNLRTIAEGVEDDRTLEQLRQFNCDEAQGYYFARPMPADEFGIYLAAQRATPVTRH